MLWSMKGILLAGGTGSRLYPMTQVVSKQLLPVYDKPLVFYPLSTLLLAGIKEVLIISTPQDKSLFEALLGNGSKFGIEIQYAIQDQPRGLAEALIIAEDFLAGSSACLILGDNIFYSAGLTDLLTRSSKSLDNQKGAKVFAYRVQDPTRYGVVSFDASGKALSLEEKPLKPKSNFVIPGLYFYDSRASQFAKSLKPSARGEIEITDLNRIYLEEGTLQVEKLPRGAAWLDTGTPESLIDAAEFVATIERRQGFKIGCPEEVAFRKGFINQKQLLERAHELNKSSYGEYLHQVAQENS